jgi:hypothetical protein
MLKEESAVNVARSIGGMKHQVEWPSGLKGSDEVNEVNEVSCEDPPDESGKGLAALSKGALIGKEGIEHLSHS